MKVIHPRTTRVAVSCVVVFILFCFADTVPATTLNGSVPAYTEAPVFYDLAWEYYSDPENLRLVHEGEVKVGTWVVAIDDFSWSGGTRDPSYWIMMETFKYLLPLIDSDRPADEEFVRTWIRGWLDTHEGTSFTPNLGSVDAMSVGKRAMTFIWYLRKLQERGNADRAWVERIKRSLLQHQEYLKDHYGTRSNHGLWEAMGLFETTRVHADSSLSRLALDRLAEMVELSVSEQGLHMEHSPAYHFWVWNWLQQFTTYLGSLKEMEWSGFQALAEAEKKMREATYYLYDHKRNMPQIGDTDATKLLESEIPSEGEGTRSPVMYDEQAGYAIFKDHLDRYLVFCIQNQAHPIWMPYHYHDDVLAVYYAYGGEIILGDQGRHSYWKGTPIRHYFLSNAAHNTIVPTRLLGKDAVRLGTRKVAMAATIASIRQAHEVSWQRDSDGEVFRGSLMGDKVTRVVELPNGAPRIRVLDTITDNEEYTILWHLGPDVSEVSELPSTPDGVSRTYAWDLTTRSKRKLEMRVTIRSNGTEKVGIVEGQRDPHLGWYSPARSVELPAKVIRIDLHVGNSASVETTVAPKAF